MQIFGQILSKIESCNEWVLNLFKNIAMILTATMTLIVLVQVFCRYFLNNALAWPEEVAKFMMVWMTFLVAPYAYRKSMNVNVELVIDKMPKIMRAMVEIVLHVFVAIMAIYLLQQGMDMTTRGMAIRASSFDMKLAYVYCILPVSFGMMFIVSCEKLLGKIIDFSSSK